MREERTGELLLLHLQVDAEGLSNDCTAGNPVARREAMLLELDVAAEGGLDGVAEGLHELVGEGAGSAQLGFGDAELAGAESEAVKALLQDLGEKFDFSGVGRGQGGSVGEDVAPHLVAVEIEVGEELGFVVFEKALESADFRKEREIVLLELAI